MLLQKTYRPDFRTKKSAVNHGNVRQYYVEGSHEPIIDRTTFDAVQREMKRREAKWYSGKASNDKTDNLFGGLIVCGICGSLYKRKHQHCQSYSSYLWLCNKYNRRGKNTCGSQKIPEDILIAKTKAVLGADTLTRTLLEEKLSRIIVPAHNRLTYHFKDGCSIDVNWEHHSRKASWSPEMKEKARQRAIEHHRQRKEEQ